MRRPYTAPRPASTWYPEILMKGMFRLRRFVSLRFFGSLAALALAALHVPLLLQRFSDNSISEPVVLVRWSALALLAGLQRTATRRLLVRGRSARPSGLVLLLHAGLVAPQPPRALVVAPVVAGLPLVLASRVSRAARPRGACRSSGAGASPPSALDSRPSAGRLFPLTSSVR